MIIPLLRTPHDEKEIFYIYFSLNDKSLKVSFHNSEKSDIININEFPIEKCGICSTKLNINTFYFKIIDKKAKYFCPKCVKDNEEIYRLKLSNENSNKDYEIIKKLKDFQNKSISNEYYNMQMNELIKLTKKLLIYFDMISSKKEIFNTEINSIKAYLDYLTFYLEEINRLKIFNLYLFIRNILIIANVNKSLFLNFIDFYKNNVSYNNPKLCCAFILKIIKSVFNIDFNKNKYYNPYQSFGEGYKFQKLLDQNLETNLYLYDFNLKPELRLEFYYTKQDLIEINLSKAEQTFNFIKLETEFLKEKINSILNNYYYSYSSISSKKIFERKIINSILFYIIKKYYDKFMPVEGTKNIYKSIIQELKKIKSFLNKKKDDNNKDKDNKIIKNLEFKINILNDIVIASPWIRKLKVE